jgi:hypothetical protein
MSIFNFGNYPILAILAICLIRSRRVSFRHNLIAKFEA